MKSFCLRPWPAVLVLTCSCTSNTEVFRDVFANAEPPPSAGTDTNIGGAASSTGGSAASTGGSSGENGTTLSTGGAATGCPAGFTGSDCATPEFIPLGRPDGALDAWVSAINGDGSVVVGGFAPSVNGAPQVELGGYRAYRWTKPSGLQEVPVFPGDSGGHATGVSHDGAVIAAASYVPGGGEMRVVRCQDGLATDLGLLPNIDMFPGEVSGDGSLIIGRTATQAFAYRALDGARLLSVRPGTTYSTALGANADGSVIVGGNSDGARVTAVRWSLTATSETLEELEADAQATAVSADGSIIAGDLALNGVLNPVRWTAAEGRVELGVLETLGYESAHVRNMSADGSIIIGEAYPGEPWIWREETGVRTLRDVLTEAGVDLLGWDLATAVISADGRVMAGTGYDPARKGGSPWLTGLP